MGGWIKADSIEGRGSTFTFEVELEEVQPLNAYASQSELQLLTESNEDIKLQNQSCITEQLNTLFISGLEDQISNLSRLCKSDLGRNYRSEIEEQKVEVSPFECVICSPYLIIDDNTFNIMAMQLLLNDLVESPIDEALHGKAGLLKL